MTWSHVAPGDAEQGCSCRPSTEMWQLSLQQEKRRRWKSSNSKKSPYFHISLYLHTSCHMLNIRFKPLLVLHRHISDEEDEEKGPQMI